MVTATKKLKDDCFLEENLSTNPDGILKSRDITLPTKVRLVKAMVFPVVMYGCEEKHLSFIAIVYSRLMIQESQVPKN